MTPQHHNKQQEDHSNVHRSKFNSPENYRRGSILVYTVLWKSVRPFEISKYSEFKNVSKIQYQKRRNTWSISHPSDWKHLKMALWFSNLKLFLVVACHQTSWRHAPSAHGKDWKWSPFFLETSLWSSHKRLFDHFNQTVIRLGRLRKLGEKVVPGTRDHVNGV